MATATEKPKFKIEDLSESTQSVHKTAVKALAPISDKGTSQFEPGYFESELSRLSDGTVTKETYVKIMDIHDAIYKGAGLAVGEAGTKAMKKNAELSTVTVTMPTFGKDVIQFGLRREAPYTLRDGDGKVTGTGTSYGSLTVDHKIYGTKNRGEMSKVKSIISELAAASIGNN